MADKPKHEVIRKFTAIGNTLHILDSSEELIAKKSKEKKRKE
jgi:hypothetical protein